MSAVRALTDALEYAYLMSVKLGVPIYVRPTGDGYALDPEAQDDALLVVWGFAAGQPVVALKRAGEAPA
jgi:hypothetical protein